MKKFSFYYVSDDYIEFLHTVDYRVALNKGELRPYVGIVLRVADTDYYVPLTSPKDKHRHMKNSLDFRKIAEGKFGAMNFNNMIPVPETALREIIIDDVENEQYRRLLRNQYQALDADWLNIQKVADQLYDLVLKSDKELNGYQRIVKRRCCDFELLEKRRLEYLKEV